MQSLDSVRQFVQALEAVQDDQAELFRRKRAALAQARSAELQALADPEAELIRRMQKLLSRRQEILHDAARDGSQASSITALVEALPGNDLETPDLRRRITRAKQRAEQFRRENLVHWIVAQRTHAHYTELIELIAHRGRRAPTYANGPARDPAGGALLDASA